ncbi:MAG: hypothetical protein C0P75_007065 [Bacilli bacterium]|uniref:DUF3895 domain-containing protein n=1 Tax=Ureibacillus suwonensis TaxID=313007 RepID=A0ABW0RA39_9BACL|nr:hypothetical protein [Bacilli bacterium]
MKPPLTKEERESLYPYATQEQLDFLMKHVKQGFRTKFFNLMAEKKVTLVRSQDISLEEIEKDASHWILDHYIDHGKGNYLGRCACNRKLRRIFTVKHEITGKTIDYGEEHFMQFLSIDKDILRDLIKDFSLINLEMDELLIKIKENRYGYELLETTFHGMDLPEDIQAHIHANVPLLDRQIERLYRKLRKMEKEMRKAQEEALMKAFIEEKNHMLEQLEQERKKLEEIVERVRRSLPPNATKEMIAYQLVLNGIHSTVEICHILIDYFGQDGTLSAGIHKRPRILPSILQYFLEQTEKGHLILVEKLGVTDCIFKPNDDLFNIELEMEENDEANQEEEQLSLFF